MHSIARQKASSMTQIDVWCKRLKACICAKGRYFERLVRMFTFCDQKKIQVILAKRLVDLLEISSKGLYFYFIQLPIRLD